MNTALNENCAKWKLRCALEWSCEWLSIGGNGSSLLPVGLSFPACRKRQGADPFWARAVCSIPVFVQFRVWPNPIRPAVWYKITPQCYWSLEEGFEYLSNLNNHCCCYAADQSQSREFRTSHLPITMSPTECVGRPAGDQVQRHLAIHPDNWNNSLLK